MSVETVAPSFSGMIRLIGDTCSRFECPLAANDHAGKLSAASNIGNLTTIFVEHDEDEDCYWVIGGIKDTGKKALPFLEVGLYWNFVLNRPSPEATVAYWTKILEATEVPIDTIEKLRDKITVWKSLVGENPLFDNLLVDIDICVLRSHEINGSYVKASV